MKRLLALIVVVLIVLTGGVYAITHKTPAKPPQQAQNAPETLNPDTLLTLVNQARIGAGVPALTSSPELAKSAAEKCDDMVSNNYFSHINPKTGVQGYTYAQQEIPTAQNLVSENIDQNVSNSSEDIFNDFFNSPEHKAAMLNSQYTLTGIAVCKVHDIWQTNDVVEHFAGIPAPAVSAPQAVQYSPQATTKCITQAEPAVGTFPATSVTSCN